MTRMDANAVLALMQVLADPEATKRRLAELMVQVDKDEAILDETRAKLKDINEREAKLQLWENDLENLNTALKSAQASLESERLRQSDAAKALNVHEDQLKAWAAEQVEDRKALDVRETQLNRNLKSLYDAQQDLSTRERRLSVNEASLASRLAKMKELSNG